jgi:hypothetical protein
LQVFHALGGVDIFVDQAVEDGFSADLPCVDVGYGRAVDVGFVLGDVLGDALVRPVCSAPDIRPGRRASASPMISTRSRSSRRKVPTRRSQIAFIRGAWTALRRIVVPVASKTGRTRR